MAQYNLQNESVTTDNNNNVISSASLTPTPTIQPVTPKPDTTNYAGITGGVTQSVIDDYANLNKQVQAGQQNQANTGSDILTLMSELSGKTADTQAANTAAGVDTETTDLNKYTQQLADLNSQASSLNREAQAIPIQVQQNNQGTGATDVGVAPQNAGALRLNTLKALSIGQQSDIAAAAATGSQLRLQAAKDKAQQIVDLKYKPIEDNIALKQEQYNLNKDTLDAIDKKRSEALQISITKEAQDAADKKANDIAIQNIAVQAAQSGASPETLKAIQTAQSPTEAVTLAGHDLGAEFRQKIAQDDFNNKIQLAQVAISKANVGIAQASLNLQKTKEAFDEAVTLAGKTGTVKYDENGKPVAVPAATPVMQQSLAKANIDLVGGLLTSSALNAAVGPNALARGGIHLGPIPIVPTTFKALSGDLQNFFGGVQQLTSQLSLTALENAKANGATFGALSEGELGVLSNSATKLNQWAIKDSNGKVTGYDANEGDFKAELDKINNFAKLDYVLKGGKPDDVGVIGQPDGTYWTKNSDGSLTQLE